MEIRILGELAVVRADGIVAPLPPSKKTRALLAYLVATAEPQLRSRLCELLWEGPDDPRAALRWSLTKLRALFDAGRTDDERPEQGPIASTSERIAFVEGAATVDLLEHRRDLARGIDRLDDAELRRAAARFRGDFLEGLELPDCYRFHEWCTAQREALRRSRVAILSGLVERLADRPEDALVYARTWAQMDPLPEAAHVAVIRMLGRLGRRREAVEQYERCRRILEVELGALPSVALETARASSSASAGPVELPSGEERAGSVRVPARAAAASPLGAPPVRRRLVGRDVECAALTAAVSEAAAGRARAPLIVLGEAGVGKTRLLEELSSSVCAGGGLALAGRAFEAEMARPYGPWIDALRSVPLLRSGVALGSELATLLPELSDGGAPSADRTRLFDAVVRLLSSLIVRGRALTVIVDDVQWIDEASAALLDYVVRATIPGVVFALGARPGEIDDNAAARRLFRTLRRETDPVDIPVGPLSREHTAQLVDELDAGADAGRIHAESEGHPLFIIELVRARATAPSESSLPSTLNGLLRERLERLDERALSLVSWAAALGRSFRLAVLVEVLGRSAPDVLPIVEDLERRGILRSAAAGTTQFGYDFSHDLVRRAAYDRLSEPRRRLCHAHIAGVLSKGLATDDSVADEVLRHAAFGGEDALATRAAVLAARRCVRLFAYSEAAETADRGRRHAARLPRLARLEAEIGLLAVLVLIDPLRRSAELEAALVSAIADADVVGKHELLVEAFRALAILQHYRGDIATSAESLDRSTTAGRSAQIETVVSALAHAGRCYAMVGHELPRARELLGEARTLSERHGVKDPELAFGGACLAHFDGDVEKADRLFAATLGVVRAAGDHWRECECLIRMTILAIDGGNYGRAVELAAELGEVAGKMGDGASEPQIAEALGALAELGTRGVDVTDARARVRAAVATLRAVDSKGMLAYVLGSVAWIELDAGELDAAEGDAREAREMAGLVHGRDQVAFALALLALIAQARGDREEAGQSLSEATALAAQPDTLSARTLAAAARARDELSR